MFQWLDQNKEWLFSGLGATLTAVVFGFLYKNFNKYLLKIFIKSREKEIEEKIHDRLKDMLAERSLVDIEVDIDTDDINNIELYCVLFSKNEVREHSFDRIWVIDAEFKIDHTAEGFSIEKSEISKRLKHFSFPYKFYMAVPNDPEIKKKYYSRLLESKKIVTGRGSINKKDNSKWNIWFLLNNQPIHPDVQFPGSINHTLVNQVLIRNSVYSAKD